MTISLDRVLPVCAALLFTGLAILWMSIYVLGQRSLCFSQPLGLVVFLVAYQHSVGLFAVVVAHLCFWQ